MGKTVFKESEGVWSASSMLCPFKCFKGVVPQILLGPFLNTCPKSVFKTETKSIPQKWAISHGQDEHSTEFSEQEIFYFSGSVLEKRSLKKKQKKFHIKTYGKSTWTL